MKKITALNAIIILLYLPSMAQNIVVPFSLSDQFHFYTGAALESNWNRGVIANNMKWNDNTKRWERGPNHYDFSMLRFANDGIKFIHGVDWSLGSISYTNQEIEEDWTRLTINHDGNVGIGTLVPKSKLHVEGDIFIPLQKRIGFVCSIGRFL